LITAAEILQASIPYAYVTNRAEKPQTELIRRVCKTCKKDLPIVAYPKKGFYGGARRYGKDCHECRKKYRIARGEYGK
jgi:hypothetical protein